MELSLIHDDESPYVDDFKHLVETESIVHLNEKINRLVISGWELRYVKKVPHPEHKDCWHALLCRSLPVVSSIEIG